MGTATTSVLAAACGSLLLAGCAEFQRNVPGDGFGQITVGSPRIEGRERLINDRREQERWLRDRLDKLNDAPFGVSGATDLRSLSSTALQLGVNADPNLPLDAINRQRQTEALRQAADDERALATFRSGARDQVIAKFNKQELTAAQARDELEKLGFTVNAPTVSSDTKVAADAAAAVAGRKPNNTLLSSDGSKVLPPDTNPRRADLTSTPIEDFHDRLAAREVIRNELNDIRLDDLHDLNGNTQYRLTFDTGVMPHNDASAWAMVRMKISLPAPDAEMAKVLQERAQEQFLRSVRDSTEATYRTLVNRMNRKCFAQEVTAGLAKAAKDKEEQGRAFRRAVLCATDQVGSNSRRSLERHLAVWSPEATLTVVDLGAPANQIRAHVQELLLQPPAAGESAGEYKFRRETLAQWAVWLGVVMDSQLEEDFRNNVLSCFYDLKINQRLTGQHMDRGQSPGPFRLSLSALAAISQGNETRCGGPLGADSVGERFRKLLAKSITGSVYSVTPKETVQRLSEVASNRKATEFLLNLSAVTSSAGIAAGFQSFRANEAFYQALRRQPLVVGITESGRLCAKDCPAEMVFSWVLGPSFQLSADGKASNFRHMLSQKAVAAELSVPAWMDSFKVAFETFWVRETGEVVATMSNGQTVSRAGSFVVRLPAQPLEALAAIDDRSPREPRVDAYQYLDVVEGETAAVLITGKNIWRSTEVYIGAQPAALLNVLPDNRGVIATFDKIRPTHGAWKPIPDSVLLTLVTSEGRVDAGRVTIQKKKDDKAEPISKAGAITGMPPRVVAGAEHTLVLPAAVQATDEAVVRIRSKKDVKLAVLLDKTTQLDDDRKTILFVLAAKDVPNLRSGDSMLVDLIVRHASGSTEVFEVVKSGIYYDKADDTKGVATASRPTQTAPLKVALALPKNAVDGFKSLSGGTAKLTAKIKFAELGDPEILEGECKITKDACTVALSGSVNFKDRLSKLKNADIKLSVALTGEDVPGLAPDPVIVKP